MDFNDPAFPFYNVGSMLSASKRTSYREHIIRMFDSYIRFLQGNGLTTRQILAEGELPTADTKIVRSDLTGEGIAFIKRAEQKWLGAVDRGTPPENTTILERELKKLRGEKPE